MKKNKQLKAKTKAKKKAPKVLTVKKILEKKEGVKLLPSKKEEEFKTRKVKVKVVGLGGGGASVISEIFSLLHSQSFLAADTDIRTAKKIKRGVKFFQFGQNILQGMGTGMNTVIAERVALEEKEKIGQIFQGQDICVLVGCLGGGVASGAGPVFAAAAKEQKCISIGIFTLPFSFEGEKKMKVAKKAIAELKEHLSGIIVVSNERIFQLADRKISLKKALSSLNQIFAFWLLELFDVVFKPSLINIDFADLGAILRDRGHMLFFSQAQASGPNRVDDVIKKIFQNNLLTEPPKNVKRVLFNIAGGKDLKLKEVEFISEEIARLNPKAKIIFGVSQISQQKEKIKVVLLAVCDEDRRGKLQEERQVTPNSQKNTKKSGEKSPKDKKKSNGVKIKIKLKNGVGLVKKAENSQNQLMAVEKIRRSALEVQKADEEAEKIEWAGDANWDIPAFLRDKLKK
ncbi:MAG: hypothetical protein PHW31_03690 [Candidatus Pacebacteria bacterium]|nr:hypothetical protein [Candidatus Paceibacterota bacterium]